MRNGGGGMTSPRRRFRAVFFAPRFGAAANLHKHPAR
jgi:hypothetical protein